MFSHSTLGGALLAVQRAAPVVFFVVKWCSRVQSRADGGSALCFWGGRTTQHPQQWKSTHDVEHVSIYIL